MLLLNLKFSSLRHKWPQAHLAILFRHIWLSCLGTFGYPVQAHLVILFRHIWLSCSQRFLNNLSFQSVPDEDYSRNATCALNQISTFSVSGKKSYNQHRRVKVLFTLFVFVYVYWCLTHIMLYFCFVCLRLVCPMLPDSLDCPYLIASSVFSDVYRLKSTSEKN